jgi:hypothetical protein
MARSNPEEGRIPFNFALEYAISKAQAGQEGLNLNGTHQLCFCTYNCKQSGVNKHTIKKYTEALLVASKKFGIKISCYFQFMT